MTVRRSTMTTPAWTKIGGRERAVRNTLSGENDGAAERFEGSPRRTRPGGRDLHRAIARRHKGALWPHNIKTSTECLLGSEPSKAWTLQRYGRCSLSSSSLRSVLLPLTGPSSATGSGTSTLRTQGIMSDHSAVTGKAPHQVARADSLREITDADMMRGRIDLVAYLQDFWKDE